MLDVAILGDILVGGVLFDGGDFGETHLNFGRGVLGRVFNVHGI